jgi:hypothetical protein
LAAVTVVILISICKMVFQLFVRYTVKHDKWRRWLDSFRGMMPTRDNVFGRKFPNL